MLDEQSFQATCRALYQRNDPADAPELHALIRDEMAARRADPTHDGDRLLLLALLLALHRRVEDVPLLWAIKQMDFDMGCLFDPPLLVFAGEDETLNYLLLHPEGDDAYQYIELMQASGAFTDMGDYLEGRLTYFGLA